VKVALAATTDPLLSLKIGLAAASDRVTSQLAPAREAIRSESGGFSYLLDSARALIASKADCSSR
jgi:hypothetical protein